MSYAQRVQLRGHGAGQIEEMLAIASFSDRGRVGQCALDGGDYLWADGVVRRADSRPDAGPEGARLCAKVGLHGLDGCGDDAGSGAAPSCVGQSRRMMLRVVEEHGGAISEPQQEGDARLSGDQGVRLSHDGPALGRADLDDVASVHLMGTDHLVRVQAESLPKPPVIFGYSCRIVAHSAAQVERGKVTLTDTAEARDQRMLERTAWPVKCVPGQAVALMSSHGQSKISLMTSPTQPAIQAASIMPASAIFCSSSMDVMRVPSGPTSM